MKAVTMVIEDDYNSIHNRISPPANTYNSDVETFHRLIEDENLKDSLIF